MIIIDIAKWFMYNCCLEKERKSEKVYQKTQYNSAKKTTFFLSADKNCSLLAFSIAPLEGQQNRHHIIKSTVKTRLLELYFHQKKRIMTDRYQWNGNYCCSLLNNILLISFIQL